MALQKQIVAMSVVDGLDTKTDEKNVLPTKFVELENGVFTKTGALSKRPGYDRITSDALGGTTQANGQALTTFKNELLQFSNNGLASFSESENLWAGKGVATIVSANETPVSATGYILNNPAQATVYNVKCYVYESKSLGGTLTVNYRVIDNQTGAVLQTGELAAGTSAPQVKALNNTFILFYLEAGTLKFRTLEYTLANPISSATSITSVTDNYDTCTIGQKTVIVTPDTTGFKTFYIDNSLSLVTGPAVSDTAAAIYISINLENVNDIRIVYTLGAPYTTSNCKTCLYNNDLTYQIHAPIVIYSGVAVSKVASIINPTVGAASHTYADIDFGGVPFVSRGSIRYDASFTLEVSYAQAGIQSKPQILNGLSYILLSKLEPSASALAVRTYYMVSSRGEILSQFLPNNSVILANGTQNQLPNVEINGEVLEFIGVGLSEFQDSAATSLQAPTVIKKLNADFSQATNYFDSVLGDNLHISGGVLKMYDSNKVVEHGFLEIPRPPLFISETGVGAVLPNGTYQYTYCYSWRDRFGQIHRSAPAVPLSYTVSAGPKKPSIRFYYTTFTNKDNVQLELYRTEANGTVFYKLAFNYADIVTNNPTLGTYVFTDTVDDATLITHEALYTNGGVLDNVAAEPSSYITTYKNRIFLLLSDKKTLQYSKLREQNGPVEFNDALKINLDERGGAATALAIMDDNLIIFKERGIFNMSGDGPNNLGEQDDYRLPALVTSDAGCIEPNSIVTVPNGIMFKSEKGIYILNRGFTVQYLGAPVEKYNDLTITSATLLANTNQVRFTTSSNRVLVYDYYHNRWTTFTNINAVDSVIYKGSYTYLRSNAQTLIENPTKFSDDGSYISMKLVSAWIQIAGLQGFERFYKMLILGDYKNSHKLKVSFAYNFNGAWQHEAIIDTSILDTPTYGEGIYGETSPYGGEYPLYQWRIFPKIQKCESFQFMIEDFPNGVPGEALSLSNFAAEVGLKANLYKKSDATSAAAK